MKRPLHPSWAARLLLRLSVDGEDRRFLLGDLDEEFQGIAQGSGRQAARRWLQKPGWSCRVAGLGLIPKNGSECKMRLIGSRRLLGEQDEAGGNTVGLRLTSSLYRWLKEIGKVFVTAALAIPIVMPAVTFRTSPDLRRFENRLGNIEAALKSLAEQQSELRSGLSQAQVQLQNLHNQFILLKRDQNEMRVGLSKIGEILRGSEREIARLSDAIKNSPTLETIREEIEERLPGIQKTMREYLLEILTLPPNEARRRVFVNGQAEIRVPDWDLRFKLSELKEERKLLLEWTSNMAGRETDPYTYDCVDLKNKMPTEVQLGSKVCIAVENQESQLSSFVVGFDFLGFEKDRLIRHTIGLTLTRLPLDTQQ